MYRDNKKYKNPRQKAKLALIHEILNTIGQGIKSEELFVALTRIQRRTKKLVKSGSPSRQAGSSTLKGNGKAIKTGEPEQALRYNSPTA
jgi:hypothetical protein